jgi:flagellar biosynthesis/type III secretory pathway protein FliH
MPYSCPLCGATSNRKGSPFDSRQKVVSHIDAKRDDAHAGEQGATYREQIGEGDPSTAPAPDDEATASAPSDGGQPSGDTIDMSPEEFDRAIEQTREEAYQQGYEDGKEAAGELSQDEINTVYNDGYEDGYSKAREEFQQGTDSDNWPKQLPCGHESVDADSVAETLLERGPLEVSCKDCGQRYSLT